MPQTPDQEGTFSAFSQRQTQNDRRASNIDHTGRPGSTGMELPYVPRRMFCSLFYRKKHVEL